jgi:hypothetical protein
MNSQWNLRTRLTTYLALAVFMFATMMMPLDAGAQANKVNNRASKSVLVQGTTANNGTLSGILTLTKFYVQNGALVADGVLNGTLTDSSLSNGSAPVTNQQVTALPVSSLSGGCQILNLTLGPLDLNLLGLQVHLNTVVLNITAQPGPGNLLGNLLCAVAGLLDGGLGGVLNQIAGLLNQILGLLG